MNALSHRAFTEKGHDPMNILNVMWAGGSPYMSVHKVHRQVLSLVGTDAQISNWLLTGEGLCHGLGPTREWCMPQRALKGRSWWRLLRPWYRYRLSRALLESNPDVVLIDGVGVARMLLPLLHRLPQVRAKVLFHGETRLSARDVRVLNGLPTERIALAAVSRTLADHLGDILQRPVQTLRMAHEPHTFGASLMSREQARKALGISVDAGRVFGAVGRLVESKGFEMLIHAFALAHAKDPQIRLVVLGEGSERAILQKCIEAQGLGDCITLHGHRRDMQQLYRAFDWLLVPSRAEGLGLVVQEAVLADVPVICSELPVFREQLRDAGCYLPVGDALAWAGEIQRAVTLDPGEQVRQQRQALAPEQSWQAFKEGSERLLRG